MWLYIIIQQSTDSISLVYASSCKPERDRFLKKLHQLTQEGIYYYEDQIVPGDTSRIDALLWSKYMK